MATGKRPDPRRRKTVHPHSTNFKVECGEKHPAWIAGELYGCYTHRTHAAQPCVSSVTDDEVPCPYCTASVESVWKGYVPLWDRDWTLRHALISEDYLPTVDAIGFHVQVSVSRAKSVLSPLIIREENVLLSRQLPNARPWKDPVCMLAVCLTLWKNAALTAWVQKNRPLALTGGEQPAVSEVSTKPVAAPPIATVKPFKGATKESALEANFDALTNRIKDKAKNLAPQTNGANGKH